MKLMQPSTIVKLKYKDVHSYRYRVNDDVFIPFLNDDMKHAMSFLDIVNHPYFVINKDGVFANKNYAWDGATYAINTKNLIIPSLVHDILCQAISLGLLDRKYRPLADKEYHLRCLESGVSKTRAAIQYIAIRIYATVTNTKTNHPAPFDIIHSVTVDK